MSLTDPPISTSPALGLQADVTVAQGLRALAVLPENSGSVPGAHAWELPLSAAPVAGQLKASGLCRHQARKRYTYPHKGKTLFHSNFNWKKKMESHFSSVVLGEPETQKTNLGSETCPLNKL